MPFTSLSWKMMKSMIIGSAEITSTARIIGMFIENSPLN